MSLLDFNTKLFNKRLVGFVAKTINIKKDRALFKDFLYAYKLAAPYREKAHLIFSLGRCFGLNNKELLLMAIVSELIMVAALTEDDFFDNSLFRSDEASFYKKGGNKKTACLADFIYSLAIKAMIRLWLIHDSEYIKKIIDNYTEAFLKIQKVQYIKLAITKRELLILTPNKMDYIAGESAGHLYSATLSSSAYLVNRPREGSLLSKIGFFVGVLLQHSNDVVDFVWGAKDLGRDGFEDLINGQPNLVLAFFVQSRLISQKDKKIVFDVWLGRKKHINKRDKINIINIINKSGAIDDAKEHLNKISLKINGYIKKLKNNEIEKIIADITSLIKNI